MDSFHLSKNCNVSCRSEKTRYGFRHLAVLYKNGFSVARSKACYYNRTWESYTFQSVVHSVISSYFSPQLAGKYKKKADALGSGNNPFRSTAAVAQ